LAIDIALDAALWREKVIVFFSLEKAEKTLVYRMIRNLTGIDITAELSVGDKQRLASAIAYLKKLNIFIEDAPGIMVTEMEAKLQKLQELQDVGMVVIDYVQLVTVAANRLINGHDNIRWIVQNISCIAAEKQISILLLSLLPRSVEFRLNKRPCLEDMYYGIYARDVDQVIFLYRENVYNKQMRDDSAEIIIAKSKFGINQTIQMQFNEKHLRFEKDNRRNL
jgi:replicative DNA helicase